MGQVTITDICSLYSLALDEESVSALGLDTVEQPWVDTMLKFRLLSIESVGTSSTHTYIHTHIHVHVHFQ